MKLSELVRALGYEVLVEGAEGDVSAGYTSDLLSDVMANCPDEAVWITIQRHMNVIAVAQLKRISAIVLVNQTEPDAPVLGRARDEGVYVLKTRDNAFQASGKIYALLEKGSA